MELETFKTYAELGVSGLLFGIIVAMYRSFLPWLKGYADDLKGLVSEINVSLAEIRQGVGGQSAALQRLEADHQRHDDVLHRVELDQARIFTLLNEEQPSRRSTPAPPAPASAPARA